ncbi:CocE/NonD family hydrolase [Novosphingobium rosa]|uniref:CocE/NonD family hydrolase n=1 Tax=Novosphingobium rosa TaxID=76978 RepID=UPI000A06D2EE
MTGVSGLVLALGMMAGVSMAQAKDAPLDAMTPDKVASYDWVRPEADYVRQEVMIPMRDGVKLHTFIVYRKGVTDAPIILSRTPYDADASTSRNRSQKIEELLPVVDTPFVNDGYIRVYQDVRGLHGSEGDYVMTRPLRGPLNPTAVDHATDAYDTIDWLVKNLKNSNGKVGITGSSYLGFTSLMALIDPHPALKAAIPQSPMVDGWMGDDWFHNGAFRAFGYNYVLSQTVKKGGKGGLPMGKEDEYATYLAAGSAGDLARKWGVDQLPGVRKMLEHPAYDTFWQEQALDKLLARRPLTVPTMLVVGEWDQEDSWGTPAVYRALSADPAKRANVSIVVGPWRHSGVNYEGSSLGNLKFEGDTALQWRLNYMKPFFDCHLKTNPAPCHTPRVITYATGTNTWEEADDLSPATTPLYLGAHGEASFDKPASEGVETYVSDPAKPVPSVPRPVSLGGDEWKTWLVQDQRFADGRTDVLSFKTGVLTAPVHIRGAPKVDLRAATSGKDSDYVVKLIDVYPGQNTANPVMAGYELGVGIEIFRGRYVHGFATPAPLVPGKTYAFQWLLPTVDHVFLPGHRIMVQVQSSLFPVYDRNPQSWVPSIMDAKAEDYVKATETIHWGGKDASAVWLPVVK